MVRPVVSSYLVDGVFGVVLEAVAQVVEGVTHCPYDLPVVDVLGCPGYVDRPAR